MFLIYRQRPSVYKAGQVDAACRLRMSLMHRRT